MTTKQITLTVSERASNNLKALRNEGQLPAVFYGPQEEATPISINAKDFDQVWSDAGESTIIVLKGIGEDKEVLVKDVQWHPLSDEALHVDFYVIERGKLLTVSIPLEFEGEAPAEKLGGNINKNIHELEMEVKPSEIPQHITIDLTQLVDLSSVITVADLALPSSATPTGGLEEVVASITAAVEEDLSAPVGEAMAEEPEEESKGEEKAE